MIKQENIDIRVQRELFKKINSLNKFGRNSSNFVETSKVHKVKGEDVTHTKITNTGGTKFFIGDILDVSEENPINQEFYRMAWAKVCVAVPNIKASQKAKSRIVLEPLSISSYMNDEKLSEELSHMNPIKKFQGNNNMITFNQGLNNDTNQIENRYRGHSGITSIKSTQKEFFTNEYVVEWECPDPVYFEQVFEPAFLNLGACMTFEFGYGNHLGEAEIPPMTIETMKAYLKKQGEIEVDGEVQDVDEVLESRQTIRERNMIAPGKYFCDIGVVSKFDYKIDNNGVYKGSITALSMGASPLLETEEPKDESDRTFDTKLTNLIERNKIGLELLDTDTSGAPESFDRKELLETTTDTSKDLKKLLESGTTFKAVIKNIDKVLEEYFKKNKIEKTSEFKNKENIYPVPEDTDPPIIDYKFKDGALYFDFNKGVFKNNQYKENENFTKQYYMSWGFFEDIILRSFFELSSGGITLQEIRSVEDIKLKKVNAFEFKNEGNIKNRSNQCLSSPFLYSMGLKSVMLPGKTHPLLTNPFKELTQTRGDSDDKILAQAKKVARLADDIQIVQALYTPEQLKNLEVTKTIFNMFDRLYRPFDNKKDTTGHIRHMVFPIEMYKTHFENATSLRQSLVSFWAEVTEKYGGFWRFVVGQSQTRTTRIGVSDLRLSPKSTELTREEEIKQNQQNEIDKVDSCFQFEIYSKNSIVKSYDLSLDMDEEAATLARYGKYRPKNSAGNITSLADVSVEAFNILTTSKSVDKLIQESALKKKVDKVKELNLENGLIRDLSYISDNGRSSRYVNDNYYDSIKRRLNEDGFDFSGITEVNIDSAQELEKINNDYSSLYRGVGIYDKDGNMSTYFKKTMIYLLVHSKFKESKSLITSHPMVIPVSISMTLDGIGGLKVGDIFKVDYLPEPYRKNVYFVIKKVDHSVSAAGWTTDIEAYMQFNPNDYKIEERKEFLSIEENKLKRLFEFSSDTVNFQDFVLNLADTTKTRLFEYRDNIINAANQYRSYRKYFKKEKGKFIINEAFAQQEIDKDNFNVGAPLTVNEFMGSIYTSMSRLVDKVNTNNDSINQFYYIESLEGVLDELLGVAEEINEEFDKINQDIDLKGLNDTYVSNAIYRQAITNASGRMY